MRRLIPSLFLAVCAFAREPEWPGFRGPVSNPAASNSALPDKWSATSNIEWVTPIPGLGWSSPIVSGRKIFLTTVTTDGQAKQPQAGSSYSNDYIAELSKVSKIEKVEDVIDNPPKPVVIFDKLPKDEAHGWKFIGIGPDNKLYVRSDSPETTC